MVEHEAIVTVVDRIRRDVIGGAADIAKEVMAAFNLYVKDSNATSADKIESEIKDAALDILRVTPSFAPPVNAINSLLVTLEQDLKDQVSVAQIKQSLIKCTDDFHKWAENALNRVAQYGAEKVQDGNVVFMYSMSSTVWRILRKAKSQGKSFEVVVTESRPGNEGLWTVDEMLKCGVPVSASIDACIGELVPRSNVVFVGADAVSTNGNSFCKVGTYPTALIAKHHGVPFYVAADTLKFDAGTLLGLPFRADPVPRQEVLGDKYPAEVRMAGTLFDETPPDLVTGIITEIGILHPTASFDIIQRMKLSTWLGELLPDWAYGKL